VDTQQLQVLVESDPIPPLPIAVRGDLDGELVKRVRSALLNLNQDTAGPALLARIGATHITAAEHAEYVPLSRLIDAQDHAAP